MSEHTPLRVRKDMFGWPHIYDSDGERISNSRPSFSLEDWGKICRRIVACVNACEGIETKMLEDSKLQAVVAQSLASDIRAKEAERLLRNLVEADETVVTASYCEYCDSHADKNDDGQLTAPVLHSIGCPMKEARAFLDRRPK